MENQIEPVDMKRPPKPVDILKTCKICHLDKFHGFRWNKKGKRYYTHSCRDCSRAAAKKYHKENPISELELKRILAIHSEMQKKVKQLCVDHLGGECKCCGLKTKYLSVYEFHHNTGKKNFGISGYINQKIKKKEYKSLDDLPELKSELILCELLCANCHRIKHENSG